jgi:hypothetical protein
MFRTLAKIGGPRRWNIWRNTLPIPVHNLTVDHNKGDRIEDKYAEFRQKMDTGKNPLTAATRIRQIRDRRNDPRSGRR